MAWEWVQPAATAVVGIGGLTATAWTAWSARQHAEHMADKTIEAAMAAAREARYQQRLDEAYVPILTYLSTMHGNTVALARRPDEDEARWLKRATYAPDVPGPEEISTVEALIFAYGSQRVRQLFAAFHDVAASLHNVRSSKEFAALAVTFNDLFHATAEAIRAEMTGRDIDRSLPPIKRLLQEAREAHPPPSADKEKG